MKYDEILGEELVSFVLNGIDYINDHLEAVDFLLKGLCLEDFPCHEQAEFLNELE